MERVDTFPILKTPTDTLERWAAPLRKLFKPTVRGEWLLWDEPIIYGSGSMVITPTTIVSHYCFDGELCRLKLYCTCTISGTPSNSIYIVPPVVADERFYTENTLFPIDAHTALSGTMVAGVAVLKGLNLIQLRQYDAANFSAGAGRAFSIKGDFIRQR